MVKEVFQEDKRIKVHYEIHYRLLGWNGWAHYSSRQTLEDAQVSKQMALENHYGRKLKSVRLIKVEIHEDIIEEVICG